jgi:hypothetical protein
VAYENSKTVAEYEVKILKPITKQTSLTLVVEFLDDKDEVKAETYNRLNYFSTSNMNGWISIYSFDGKKNYVDDYKRCRLEDAVGKFPPGEGPAVRFIPDKLKYEAKFSGGRTDTVEFELETSCKDRDAIKAAMTSAKKIRFLLDSNNVDHLGEFVAVQYRFVNQQQ